MPPEIGIVVTARNEADCLPQTLAALARAFPGASVVVADDGSSDATPDVARDAGADVVRSERPVGKGGAATRGAERLLATGVERARGQRLRGGAEGSRRREHAVLADRRARLGLQDRRHRRSLVLQIVR